MIERFKKRWNIKSNFQLVIILIVFSVTGRTALYVRKGVFFLLGINADTSYWIKVPLYILIVVPAYQLLFMIVGTLFGQYKFALAFEKKMLSRFKFKKK